MTSLIEQLQAGATDSTTPITDLLRKGKLAAVKLNRPDFAKWVDRELGGYADLPNSEIPKYRVVGGDLRVRNPYHGWQPIGLQLTMPIGNSIAEISEHIGNESGIVLISIPDDLANELRQQIGMPYDIKFRASSSTFAAIVDAVRNAVLDWSWKLEEAGVRGEGLSFTRADTEAARSVSIQNVFHGPVGGVAQGSSTIPSVTQTNASATPQEIAEALGTLIQALIASQAPSATAPAAELQQARAELSAGRMPMSKLRTALGAVKDAQDIAVKAPQVVQKASELGSFFGFW